MPQRKICVIELGWLHYDKESDQFRQVRTKKVGGAHRQTIPKNYTKTDL